MESFLFTKDVQVSLVIRDQFVMVRVDIDLDKLHAQTLYHILHTTVTSRYAGHLAGDSNTNAPLPFLYLCLCIIKTISMSSYRLLLPLHTPPPTWLRSSRVTSTG